MDTVNIYNNCNNNCNNGNSLCNDKKLLNLNKCEWTFSQEREFIENLFVGRFNMFIVVFSLFMNAGFSTQFEDRAVIFYIGAAVLVLFWMTLYRIYKKLDNILNLLHDSESNHPGAILDRILKKKGYSNCYSVAWLMGCVIPWVCIIILLAIGCSICHGMLK